MRKQMKQTVQVILFVTSAHVLAVGASLTSLYLLTGITL